MWLKDCIKCDRSSHKSIGGLRKYFKDDVFLLKIRGEMAKVKFLMVLCLVVVLFTLSVESKQLKGQDVFRDSWGRVVVPVSQPLLSYGESAFFVGKPVRFITKDYELNRFARKALAREEVEKTRHERFTRLGIRNSGASAPQKTRWS